MFVGGFGTGASSRLSTFSGGISNSGTISAARPGIFVGGIAVASVSVTLRTFDTGIANSGLIAASAAGIMVGGTAAALNSSVTVSTFAAALPIPAPSR